MSWENYQSEACSCVSTFSPELTWGPFQGPHRLYETWPLQESHLLAPEPVGTTLKLWYPLM